MLFLKPISSKSWSYLWLLTLLMLWMNGNAQREGNFWYFGDRAALDFNSGHAQVLGHSSMYQREGCSTISDSLGNLMFYTNGIKIWNRNGQPMGNGQLLSGGQSATQSAIIAKKPGSSSLYYVFTVPDPDTMGVKGLRYSVIDMSLNSGLGDFTNIVNTTLNTAPTEEKVTAVYHANKKDIWIITHLWNSDAFYAFLLTENGVDKDRPVVSHSGLFHTGSFIKMAGYMKASPDGSKIAIITRINDSFQLFDFDDEKGEVSNPLTFLSLYRKAYGLEFSPSGKMLYLSDYTNGGKVVQFDLQLPPADIVTSGIDIGFVDNDKIGALQVAPDGIIYVAKFDTLPVGFVSDKYLGTINFPEKRGLACDFIEDDLFLVTGGSNLGLPTFVQSYFFKSQDFHAESVCAGDTVFFELTNETDLVTVLWDFGDPSSGTDNQSDMFHPYHVYQHGGTYQVQLISHFLANSDTLMKSITIFHNPNTDLGIDRTFCSNNPELLVAGADTNNYLWQDGSTDNSFWATTSGLYWVEATTNYGCQSTDSVTLTSIESPQVFLGNDTILNVGDVLELNVDPNYHPILWSDGTSGSQLLVSSPGTYWVTVENNGCAASDTIRVFFESHCQMYCPTAFTPNSDGVNDHFMPVANEDLQSYHLIVLNRWGAILFESEDIHTTWDGKYKGTWAQMGVYNWLIEYECMYSGETKIAKGTVALLR